MPLEKNANWLVMSVPKCITIQWYGVRNISAARRLILTPSTMHLCWENFKQNYKNFWQDLHNIKKYDSKICITFFLKSQKFFLAQVSKDFLFEFLPCISFKGFLKKVFAYTKISFCMFCSHKFLIIFQGISLLILSLHKYQMTFGFKSTVKVCFLINFDNFWEVFEHKVLFYWESLQPCLCSRMALFMMFWQIFKLLLQLSPLNSYLPYLRAFQWGNVWPYGLVRKVLNSQKAQNSFL